MLARSKLEGVSVDESGNVKVSRSRLGATVVTLGVAYAGWEGWKA